MMKTIYQQKLCCLQYHEKSNFIQMIWEGDLNNDEYKAFWTAYYNEYLKLPKPYLLVDQRKVGKVDMTARAWFVMNFLPKYKNKVRPDLIVAVMQPQNVMNKTAIQYLVSATNRLTSYQIRLFTEQDEAHRWLDLMYKQEVYAQQSKK